LEVCTFSTLFDQEIPGHRLNRDTCANQDICMYRTIVITISILILLLLGGTFISMVRERDQSEVSLSSTPAVFVETAIVETPEPTVRVETDDVLTTGEIQPIVPYVAFLPLIIANDVQNPSENIP
jgi:hypothetical protein